MVFLEAEVFRRNITAWTNCESSIKIEPRTKRSASRLQGNPFSSIAVIMRMKMPDPLRARSARAASRLALFRGNRVARFCLTRERWNGRQSRQAGRSEGLPLPQRRQADFADGSLVCPLARVLVNSLSKPPESAQKANSRTRAKREIARPLTNGKNVVSSGEPGGTRTRDPLLKRQMLYRLSYRP